MYCVLVFYWWVFDGEWVGLFIVGREYNGNISSIYCIGYLFLYGIVIIILNWIILVLGIVDYIRVVIDSGWVVIRVYCLFENFNGI